MRIIQEASDNETQIFSFSRYVRCTTIFPYSSESDTSNQTTTKCRKKRSVPDLFVSWYHAQCQKQRHVLLAFWLTSLLCIEIQHYLNITMVCSCCFFHVCIVRPVIACILIRYFKPQPFDAVMSWELSRL